VTSNAAAFRAPSLACSVHPQDGKTWYRRDGADDDDVDVGRRELGRAERPLGRLEGQVGRGDTRIGDAAFADTGAGGDPLVAGFDEALEVVVREDARRGE
jgi:hypothetical protein